MSAETDDRPRPVVTPARRGRRWRRRWILLALVLGLGVAGWQLYPRRAVRQGTVLYLDLSQALPERSGPGLLDFFHEGPGDLFDLSRALALAGEDPAVAGLLVRLAAGGLGPGTADELRGMLRRFQGAGKPVVAFASSPDTWSYHVATVADRLVLDQSTTFNAGGLRLHALFLKDALRRFGIELDLVRVGAFKGAFEELALAAPTPELEEAANALLDSLSQTVVEAVGSARGLEPQTVRALFDQAPLAAAEAVREKLVDEAASMAGAVTWLRQRTGIRPELMPPREYLAARGGDGGKGKRFAVIHLAGTILDGESRPFLLGGQAVGADTVARHIQSAAEDPTIAGILLRIDSPGGSVSAAETLHEAVVQARKAKPLVASCGAMAASGGYYAGCGAEKIVAQPTTLTGSIGVFGGKLVLEDFLEQHGIASRVYARGKRARFADATRRYTPEERQALKELLDDAYRRFVSRVSVARRKGFEEIHAVAQGRTWTGAQALEAGLIDRIGGMEDAVAVLRDLAHVAATDATVLCLWPPRGSLWSLLLGDASSGQALPLSPALDAAVGPGRVVQLVESALDDLGFRDGCARLALQPCWLRVR